MQNDIRSRIFTLLDSIKADFPRRKEAAESFMRQRGLEAQLGLEIAPSLPAATIPTFGGNISRELSPMLRARFAHSGSWKMGQGVWLDADEMRTAIGDKEIQANHKARREHWDGSAPMLFPDDRLSLFGVAEGVPEDAIYLVWVDDCDEPEIWDYAGYDFHRSKDLADYLTWKLERD